MANEQKIDEIIDQKAFAQLVRLQDELTKANEIIIQGILNVAKYNQVIGNSNSLKDLYANTEKCSASMQKLIKSQSDSILIEEKIIQIRAKSRNDLEINTQKEIDQQTKIISSEEKKVKNAQRSSSDIQSTRDKERLAELRLDSDRKKAFDNYEVRLKRKAESDERNAKQLQRTNALIEENSRAYKKLSSDLDSARKKAQDIGVAFGTSSKEFKAAATQVNELDASIRAVDTSLGLNQRNVGNYSSALNGLISNLKNVALSYLSFQGAQALLSNAFSTALQTDAIKTSLEYTFGSVEVAKIKMESLKKTANRLGLEYTSLADAYRSFAGAAVASNFPLKETDRIFNAVANAGAKLKLSSDQVSGALTALQQMISKGNVQSEELRGQLGERLPGAFAIAARAMGVTQQELGKLLKDGKVLAADLLPKLADELDKTFSNDKKENISALGSSVNRLKNSFTEIVETKGALSAFFTFVVDAAGGVVKGISKLSEALGVFYDLATHPKKFIGDSAAEVRGQALLELQNKATIEAKKVGSTETGPSALGKRINKEIDSMKELNKVYQETNQIYQKTRPGDRSLTDTKDIQKKTEALQYQIAFVKGLKNQYEILYNSNVIKQIADADLKSVKAIQTRISELKKLDGSAIIGDEIYNRIQALQARLKKPRTIKDNSLNEELELNKARIESVRDAAKRISQDEEISYDLRLKAVSTYYDKSKELLENDKRLQLSTEGLSKTQISTINQEAANKLADLDAETGKTRTNMLKSLLTKEEQDRAYAAQSQLNAIKDEESMKLDLTEKAFANGTISEKQYGEITLQLQREYAQKYINKEIEQAEALLRIATLTTEQRAKAEKELADLKLKYSKNITENTIADNKKVTESEEEQAKKRLELEKKLKDAKKELQDELKTLAITIANASFENQLNSVQAEMDLNEQKKARDIENVNDSVASEKDKADQIAIINARAEAQNNLLQQKQKEIKIRQARFNKALNIASIIENTAVAIMATYKEFGFPFGIPLAIAQGAIGAAQIATVIATPIPQYKDGTGHSKAGPAWTDELGPELYIEPGGKTFIGDTKPNIKDLKAGTQIIPHHELVKMIAKPELTNTINNSTNFKPLLKGMEDGNEKIIKALKSQKSSATVLTKRGWKYTQDEINKIDKHTKRNF